MNFIGSIDLMDVGLLWDSGTVESRAAGIATLRTLPTTPPTTISIQSVKIDTCNFQNYLILPVCPEGISNRLFPGLCALCQAARRK